jgi:hypothetical protein
VFHPARVLRPDRTRGKLQWLPSNHAPGVIRMFSRGPDGHAPRGLARGVVGSARVIGFGASNVAPAGSVVGGLVIVVAYAYALYVPAGIALTSAYASQLVAGRLHVALAHWALFAVILAAVIVVAYLGIGVSSWADLLLVAGEVAVTGVFYLLVVIAEMSGVGRPGVPGFTRQLNPLGYLAGRYWSPSATWVVELVVVLTGLGFVVAAFNAGIRVLFAMGRERALPAAIRAFRTEFRGEFRLVRHLLVPAAAAVLLMFPLWGIVHPRANGLAGLLPFAAVGWLCLGAAAAMVLRSRRPASFEALGRVFTPGTGQGASGRTDSQPARGTRHEPFV